MQKKVILYQQKPGVAIPQADLDLIRGQSPDFLCLPEYFFVGDDARDQLETAEQTPQNKEWLASLSRQLSCAVVGGTMVEKASNKFYNTCFICSKGKELGFYRKLNPLGGEVDLGISPGEGLKVFELEGVRVGVLICSDVLIPGIFKEMRNLRPQVIFCPTTSPLKEGETLEDKKRRDFEIYVSGARDSGAYIAKTCAAERLLNRKLQGRSLVAAPWGIIKRVDFSEEDKKGILTVALNLRMLKNWRGDIPKMPSEDWEFDFQWRD